MPRNHKHYASTKNTERRLKNILLTTILRNRKQSFEEQHDPYKADKKSSKKNNERAERIKWTDKASVILSFLALVTAYFLYTETVRQRQLTEQATKAAVDAVNHTLYQDSVNYNRDTANDRAQEKKDAFNMEISKQSLQEQIGSIKESQRQFEIQYRPILDIKDFGFRNLLPNTRPIIQFDLVNLGRAPAKVTATKYGFMYFPKISFNPNGYLSKIPILEVANKGFITTEAKQQVFNAFDIMPKDKYDSCIRQELVMILFGEVDYINEITGQKRKFIFNTILYPPPRVEYKPVYLLNTIRK